MWPQSPADCGHSIFWPRTRKTRTSRHSRVRLKSGPHKSHHRDRRGSRQQSRAAGRAGQQSPCKTWLST